MTVCSVVATQDYTSLRLVPLVRKVVYEADRHALCELCGRSLFLLASGRRVSYAEYRDALLQNALANAMGRRQGTSVVESAFDLLTDRLVNLPDGQSSCDGDCSFDGTAVWRSRIDCRNYLRGYLEIASEALEDSPALTPIELEEHAAQLLQKYVTHLLWYCMKEALRARNPLVSRYVWVYNGYKVTIWFPRSVRGAQRRDFLLSEIGAPESDMPEEVDRIQALIDRRFGTPGIFSYEELGMDKSDLQCFERFPGGLSFDDCDGSDAHEFIAKEKSATIGQQRRAIGSLGPDRLKALVLTVLENLENPLKSDAEIAQEYGLSKGTFSRFAGRKWREWRQWGNGGRVPDLFRNIGQLLARTARFVEAAKRIGLWNELNALGSGTAVHGKGRPNG